MPKPADYSKGFIYKIVCNDITIPNLYVGSSTDFVKRKSGHKSSCNVESNDKYNIFVYQFIREHGGWSNWTMLKLCDYPCNDKFELCLEERRYMELLKSDLNVVKPGRTKKEYQKDNKAHIRDRRVQYYDENKERIDNCNKTYREDHKEIIAIKSKDYRLKNNDALKKMKNTKYECDCGGKYTHCHKALHERSLRHKTYISLQLNEITDELIV